MQSSDLLKSLLASRPVLVDGAWGTEFQKRGLEPGAYPDIWNLERPDDVFAVARTYVEAGSRVILTNTFGANRVALRQQGLDDRVDAINRAGVELSRRAAGNQAVVFASIGPTGKLLYMDEITEEELLDVYREQSASLAAAGADALILETLTDIEEAKIALRAAHETKLPIAVSMVFGSGPEKNRTMMGLSASDAARDLEDAGADIVGANCGQGIEGFARVCADMRSATQRPLWMKPNAGLPELVSGRTVYRMDADDFARHLAELVRLGADFVGGCCGTDPNTIRMAALALMEGGEAERGPTVLG